MTHDRPQCQQGRAPVPDASRAPITRRKLPILRLAQNTFLYNLRVPVRLALRLACRARMIGGERIPLDDGVIVAANHTSFADPVVLQSFCPRHLTFLMIDRYYDTPGLNRFVRFWGCIRIREGRPNRDALRRSASVLRQGRAVGIFPEGGISRDGRVHDALPGVGLLAARADVPIVPVGLAGVDRFLPPDTWTFHRSVITMVVGEPFRAEGLGRREVAERLTAALRRCAARARERSGPPLHA